MNYFVNENIFSMNSGTEFSAAKRLTLFKRNGVPAKVLTRNYNPLLIDDLKRVGLEQADVLNMYNYFQEAMAVVPQDIDIRYTEVIDKFDYHIVGIDANESQILHHGKVVGKALVAPATVGLVGSLEYYNDMNATVAKDVWDRRGFNSSTQYFHPDGQIGPQVFYNPAGEPKLEIVRMNVNGTLMNTMYQLLNYKGRAWRFNSESELFIFFMNEIAAAEPSVLINDRPSLINEVAAVTEATAKWQYLHSVHTHNPERVGGSKHYVDYLKPLFATHINDFDGVMAATEEQKAEIDKFFHFKEVVVVPDTFADAHDLVPIKKRDRSKIVYLGRISPEKEPQEAIKIFAKAKKQLPDLHLDFYGYVSDQDVENGMIAYSKELGVDTAIQYHGYQTDEELAKELGTAAALLSVSSSEAFGMNILQAMSYGVPVIAYNVKYGLNLLVEKDVSGYLAPLGESKAAADHLVRLLTDATPNAKWADMVNTTYQKSQTFDAKAAWQQWQDQLATVPNLFLR